MAMKACVGRIVESLLILIRVSSVFLFHFVQSFFDKVSNNERPTLRVDVSKQRVYPKYGQKEREPEMNFAKNTFFERLGVNVCRTSKA